MNIISIIENKRDGGKLTDEEIRFFVNGYTEGSIPDYQVSALLMAMFIRDLDTDETVSLTKAMKESGDTIDLTAVKGTKVDKHSTGGVGDKTTLIVAPVAASAGVPVAKMSGRGLGFTGGTIDKLESIPGFNTSLSEERFLDQVNSIGMAVSGQTAKVAPADKKIYALRDVTGTVDCMGLIASSVMSKKLASGADAIVLDVKCGDGAFMTDEKSASELAKLMCMIGRADGKPTIALITDMEKPLGKAVGNALEVIEAIETLKGRGPEDITELSLSLAGAMIYTGGLAGSMAEGYEKARDELYSGRALEKFEEFVEAQGGDTAIVDDYSVFGEAAFKADLVADESLEGYIAGIKARTIGNCSQHLGAGRKTKESGIDMRAGIYLHKTVGDQVRKGDVIATLYSEHEDMLKQGIDEIIDAYQISTGPVTPGKLIKQIVE